MELLQDQHWLLKDIWPYGLVFARWFTVSLLTPGMGGMLVQPWVRVPFVLSISICLTPALQQLGLLATQGISVLVLCQEIIIGVFLGLFAKTLLQLLEVAGSIISHQAGLSNALSNQSIAEEQSSLPGTFLYMGILAFIFVNDFHHGIFSGIFESYRYFPLGSTLFLGDMAHTIIQLIDKGFRVSVQITSPFLILGTVFYLTIGLLNRLMPQIHVFFVAQPLEILFSFLIFISAINNMFATYGNFLFQAFKQLGGN